MKISLTFVAIIFAAVLTASNQGANASHSRCHRHEEWTKCGKQCGELNCSDLVENEACRPSRSCNSGCICKRGYYRDSRGDCVAPEKCPQTLKCGAHEQFVACTKVCKEKTCKNDHEERCSRCKSMCLCKKGYIRDSDNICVKKDQCDAEPRCPENEKYALCSNICSERTCDNPVIGYCAKGTCKPMCHCIDGYVRDANNKCIKHSECPPLNCGENERYEPCSSVCEEPTCYSYGGYRECHPNCQPKCLCNDGYLRDGNNKCVKVLECPPKECGVLEEWSKCAYDCERLTCTYAILLNPPKCQNREYCTPGCICKKGLYRDAAERCVTEEKCGPKISN